MDGVGGGGEKVSYGERVPITLNVKPPHHLDLKEVSFQVFSDSGPAGRLIDVTYTGAKVVVPSSGQGSMYVLAHVRLRNRSDVCYFRSGPITFPDSGSVTPTEPPTPVPPTPVPTAPPTPVPGGAGGYVCVTPWGVSSGGCPATP